MDKDTSATRTLQNFLLANCLIDYFRYLYPNIRDVPGVTYNGEKDHSPSRIDFLFTSQALSKTLASASLTAGFIFHTDHNLPELKTKATEVSKATTTSFPLTLSKWISFIT